MHRLQLKENEVTSPDDSAAKDVHADVAAEFDEQALASAMEFISQGVSACACARAHVLACVRVQCVPIVLSPSPSPSISLLPWGFFIGKFLVGFHSPSLLVRQRTLDPSVNPNPAVPETGKSERREGR